MSLDLRHHVMLSERSRLGNPVQTSVILCQELLYVVHTCTIGTVNKNPEGPDIPDLPDQNMRQSIKSIHASLYRAVQRTAGAMCNKTSFIM